MGAGEAHRDEVNQSWGEPVCGRVVVTGSASLGYRASYNLTIQGNKKLAMAYGTTRLDVYDPFAWRWTLTRGKLSTTSYPVRAERLDRHFDEKGNIKTAQLKS